MPTLTYTVDKTNPSKHDVELLYDGVVAGTVSVIWPEDHNQNTSRVLVGPYSVRADFRKKNLSYALLWVGLTLAEQAGYKLMKTGWAHGPLHDTMERAGLTVGETAVDPTARGRPVGGYLDRNNLPENTAIVWHCDNLAEAKAKCSMKLKGQPIKPASSGCCVLS